MRPPLTAWTLFAAIAGPVMAAAVAETPAKLTVEALFAPDATGRRPAQLAWSPDGQRLTYVWYEQKDGKDEALWSLEPATGKREVLLQLAAVGEGRRELELDEYAWSPRGGSLLLVAEGDLYLLPLDTRKLRRLTSTEAAEKDPSFSPDGSRIAFVRGFDLYAIDLASGRETRLTTGGEENVTLNGTPSWVYWEEIWARDAESYWWSPDGARIAFYHFDETPVGVFPLVDDTSPYPKVKWQKYPAAGEPNPRVRIGVVELVTGRILWLDTADPDSYLVRVAWTPGGDAVAVQRLNREHTHLDLLRCSAADGHCSTLLAETWPTWINLGRDFRFLPDGRFLWGSDRSGWHRLYLYSANGTLIRPVTVEGWSVTSLRELAEDGSWAVVSGFPIGGLGAIDRKVARLRLDAESWEVLTPEPGFHRPWSPPRPAPGSMAGAPPIRRRTTRCGLPPAAPRFHFPPLRPRSIRPRCQNGSSSPSPGRTTRGCRRGC